ANLLLQGSPTLINSGDNIHFTLSGLASLTRVSGLYDLTLNAAGSGIADNYGNVIVSNASDQWTINGSATVGNFVWQDFNANGIQDFGEPGLANVVVRLYDPRDSIQGNGDDVLLGETTTDGSGAYSFAGITPGNTYL